MSFEAPPPLNPLNPLSTDKPKDLALAQEQASSEASLRDWAIEVNGVGKRYALFQSPLDRLKEFFMPKLHAWLPFVGQASYAQTFWSLQDVNFKLYKGEVLGIIGVNGAGKSSLLQLICGVLKPTAGEVNVRGRIAALLELGAGFNPEFSGRENIHLNATLLGLTPQEIKKKTPDIIAFSGIESFIDQPVKTYSSGMYVRLAFAIATSVEPEILVIDEALSVGDGAFARKSFDRIMDLKAKGVTILFCSHNIYQVEALCQKAIWLDQGRVRAKGEAREVCQAYNEFLDLASATQSAASAQFEDQRSRAEVLSSVELQGQAFGENVQERQFQQSPRVHQGPQGTARISSVQFKVNGQRKEQLELMSEQSDLEVDIEFISAMDVPIPNVGVIFTDKSGRNITSCSNFYDQVPLSRDASGLTRVSVRFPKVPLMRGRYGISVFLLCERAIHIYDSANVVEVDIAQSGLELGVVALGRQWSA